MNNNIYNSIRTTVENFVNKNWDFRYFLTEDDLRCHLFFYLHKAMMELNDVSVHAEIRWYGKLREQGVKQLKYRTDIVIFNNNNLQFENANSILLPSKGYSFDCYYSIIEIKLRRPNDKNSDQKFYDIIQNDINKLIEIREKTTRDTNKKYYVLVFDKKREKKKLITVHNNENETKQWINWPDQELNN